MHFSTAFSSFSELKFSRDRSCCGSGRSSISRTAAYFAIRLASKSANPLHSSFKGATIPFDRDTGPYESLHLLVNWGTIGGHLGAIGVQGFQEPESSKAIKHHAMQNTNSFPIVFRRARFCLAGRNCLAIPASRSRSGAFALHAFGKRSLRLVGSLRSQYGC